MKSIKGEKAGAHRKECANRGGYILKEKIGPSNWKEVQLRLDEPMRRMYARASKSESKLARVPPPKSTHIEDRPCKRIQKIMKSLVLEDSSACGPVETVSILRN